MAHRFNCLTNRKEPKTNASIRTWSRYRLYHDTPTDFDKERQSKLQSVKEKVYERIQKKVQEMQNKLGGKK